MSDQKTYTMRFKTGDGLASEIEVTRSQLLDYQSEAGFAYWARDEELLVDEDATVVERESAVPRERDDTP